MTKEIVAYFLTHQKNVSATSRHFNLSRATIRRHLRKANVYESAPLQERQQREDLATLKKRIRDLEQQELADTKVRQEIFGLTSTPLTPPFWMTQPVPTTTGWPVLLLGDLHYGEIVDPSKVFGLNEYTPNIAESRLQTIITNTIDILFHQLDNAPYPGLCLALLGDMISGTIHDELSITNEMPIMPMVVNACNVLSAAISTLLDYFHQLFIPCVIGNHGRNTIKPMAKLACHTSFDWLIYQMLEQHFQHDPRVTFAIPNGTDYYFELGGTQFRLTHGNNYRGGTGFQGAMPPIMRGSLKTKLAAMSYNKPYDVLLMGHFHQQMYLSGVVVNGSIKGYDEFAMQQQFQYEPPQQALFVVHPEQDRLYQYQFTVYAT